MRRRHITKRKPKPLKLTIKKLYSGMLDLTKIVKFQASQIEEMHARLEKSARFQDNMENLGVAFTRLDALPVVNITAKEAAARKKDWQKETGFEASDGH